MTCLLKYKESKIQKEFLLRFPPMKLHVLVQFALYKKHITIMVLHMKQTLNTLLLFDNHTKLFCLKKCQDQRVVATPASEISFLGHYRHILHYLRK